MVQQLYTNISTQKDYLFEKLYEWESPDRVWEPKTRAWYVTYSFFFVVLIALAALLGEYILIIAIVAFIFLWFIQAAMPPETISHTVTTIGVKTYGKLYKWKDVKHFWFSTKKGVRFLNLEIKPPEDKNISPKTLTLLLNPEDDDREIFNIFVKYADYGDKDEINFNFISQLIYGPHTDLSYYLPELEDEVDYLGVKEKESNKSSSTHKKRSISLHRKDKGKKKETRD
jgi:hypothetical protein